MDAKLVENWAVMKSHPIARKNKDKGGGPLTLFD